jgi:serine/threonine-protein kinase
MANAENVDPLIGKTINDRFQVTSLIARGGMGKVYRGKQMPLGRDCAIKVLSVKQGEVDEDFERRFFLEASILAKLTHPNTVTVFDYGRTEDGVLYMVMEFLEGHTLKQTMRDEGPFDQDRGAHVARQMCRSLREAHSLGVVHRDLKPGNVYLVEHGDERDMVKVIDFGLVKNVDASNTEDLTQAGLFMGSPKYMAPEQIRGEHVDARTDIYAMGVMLYEMVCGEVPFDRANQVDLLLAHVNERPKRPRERKPDVQINEGFEAIIMRCLEKNPDDRFTSMDDVLAVLKEATGGRPTTETAASIELRKSLDALVKSGSNPPVPTAPDPSQLVATAADAQPKKGGSKFAAIGLGLALVAAVGIFVATRGGKDDAQAQAATSQQKPATTNSVTNSTTAAKVEPAVTAAPKPTVDLKRIHLESDPAGAKVRDGGDVLLCDTTPCDVKVESGTLTVSLSLDGYNSEKLTLKEGDSAKKVTLSKKPSYTWSAPKNTGAAANTGAAKPPAGDPGFKDNPY